MASQTLPTRSGTVAQENVSQGFAVALAGHGVAIAALLLAGYLSGRAHVHWGDTNPTTGSIQASMVDAIPLPPKQRLKENEVLTSEHPSIAPTPPAPAPPQPKAAPAQPRAEPLPKPNEVLIPTKVTPPPKPAATRTPDKPAATPPATKAPPTAAPPSATRVPAPPTPKATTGETAGVQIPQAIVQAKNGTAAVTVEERSFGDRYSYYVKLVAQKVNQSKQQDQDGPDTKGKHTAVRFTVDRDGVPQEVQVVTRSGSASLDSSTQRAVERIDTFGPLPAGDHMTFIVDYASH